MTDLTDFGLSTVPSFRKATSLELGYRTVGYLCHEQNMDTTVYVSDRRAEDHRYHGEDPWYDLPFDGDGYGLSIELFDRLHGAGVGAVYIVETDTGNVYHFGYDQFVNGTPINFEDEADDRGWEKDPQMVVAIEDAVDMWENAHPGVYAPQPGYS